jgi:hypothetical protein
VNLRLNGTHKSQAVLRVEHWLNKKEPEIQCTLWPSEITPEVDVLFDTIFITTALLGKAYMFLVIIEAVYRWRAETVG